MRKYQQNKVAESKLTLPVMYVYTALVWLICGLVREQWWIQFASLCLTAFLMLQLNNTNMLIRIYSRMVSCTFLALVCSACFLFPSIPNAIVQVCFVCFMLFLFMSYQDKQASGFCYYAYLMLGIASTVFIQIVYLIPLLWLLTGTLLQSLSWRTWSASLLGLITPYWIASFYIIGTNQFSLLADHFMQLIDIKWLSAQSVLSTSQVIVLLFVVTLTIIGTVHYLRKHHDDKIRVRLIYAFFIWMDLATIAFLLLQPQYYNQLIGIMMVLTAPLIAHFVALTSTKFTNIAFFVIIAITLIITSYNIWTLLSPF